MSHLTPPTQHSLAGQPVFLETNGFLLRSLTPADATPELVQWFNSKELLTGLNLPVLGFTQEKLAQFIASFDNKRNYFMGIFSPGQRRFVGFYTLDVNATHKVGNITTGIIKQPQGEDIHGADKRKKGTSWATIDALLDHFFTYRDVDKMIARVLEHNRRMLFNFMGNPRFVLEARLYKECLGQDGERIDVLIFTTFKNRADNEKAGRFV